MKKNKTTHFMSGIIMIFFVAIFLVLCGRFLYIQATGEINGVSLEKWAKEKRTASFLLEADRGNIYDRNGMTLAYNRPTFKIYAIVDEAYSENLAEPQHVTDPEKTADQLASFLDLDESYILERLKEGIENDRFQVEFGAGGKELSKETKDKIEALDLPGIKFEKEPIRSYPNGMFASKIIGFARKENGKITGVNGIEREMNDVLSGKPGHISYQRDKYNTKLLDPNEIIKKPENGDDVYLTIDQKIQTLLEDIMTQVEKKYKPERMSAVIMKPDTGEIVAMSNRPSFDPNNPSNIQNWYNDVISTPFEPGSTLKMFTWAAAIEAGVYNGDALYQSGQYRVVDGGVPISDHNGGRGWGTISFDEGFRRSSNVAAAKLVWEVIGAERYLSYLNRFDFNKKTGIDLPNEEIGTILSDYPRDIVSTGFGQGSTFTPIQLVKAASAIANDGKMMKPYVISKIVDSDNGDVLKQKKPEVAGTPISEETAEHVLDLLGSVVSSDDGTGQKFALKDYSVAGKTGTAQIPNPNGPGYLWGRENYVFSFLGMAPKEDPQLIMYVSVKQPELEAGEHGSVPVSFIFKNVMKNSLHYLNIEPDKESSAEVDPVAIPEIKGETTKLVQQKLTDLGLNVTVVGNGKKVVDTSAKSGDKLLPNERIILLTDKPTMPNITGWSMREVLQLADLVHLQVETLGHGYVVSQSIKEGSPIKKGDYLGVELEPPGKDITAADQSNQIE